MNPTIPLQQWLQVLQESTQEVARSGLRFDGTVPADAAAQAGRPGVYIAIFSESASLHVGLTTTPDGCRVLARSLLGLRESASLSDGEVVDAVSELVNIVAGKVKSRLAEHDSSLRLGLPLFVQGQIQVTELMERATADVRIGPVDCQLQVYRNPRRQEAEKAA
ncbi:MAG TPA: chemotaxis protein CheX [Candidatus Eisenbacteria bacterium]